MSIDKMISPAPLQSLPARFSKFLLRCNGALFQSRSYSIERKMSEPQWKIEKTRILDLPLEEKRKLAPSGRITLTEVDPWYRYAADKKSSLEDRKPTHEDLTEFRKITINEEKNKMLSEKVSVCQSDITKLEVDAIVNAANSRLKAGGGVDGAIHRAAGSHLQAECDTFGGCPVGEARISGGYKLPAKYIIHTVGPQNGSAPNLKSCYENSFACAKKYELKSIAFPCISTGIYGFPNRLAAHIALSTARKFLEDNEDMDRVIFCTFLPLDLEIYETLMQLYFPVE